MIYLILFSASIRRWKDTMFNIGDVENSIIKGDSIENLRNIPDKTIDVIFADPPYWMQTEGELLRNNGEKFSGVEDEWDKFSSYKEYDKFTYDWLVECRRVLKDSGSIWVIGSFQNIYRVGYIMQDIGFWILNDIVWSKPNAVPNFSGTRFKNSHETLLWCSKNKKSKYRFNYKTMKHLNGGKQDNSVWDIGICIGKERLKDGNNVKIHSTQKPEKLLHKIILSSSKPGDIILDPFFGTGTTGAVAKRLGRKFIGIEREDKYIYAAQNRISKVKESIDDISLLKLEIKPPRVSMLSLIESGMLIVGESFLDKNGEQYCKLLDNGYVYDGHDILSIHKMSAKILKKVNNNGWDFFFVTRDNKLKSINDFRYEYSENKE